MDGNSFAILQVIRPKMFISFLGPTNNFTRQINEINANVEGEMRGQSRGCIQVASVVA